MEVNEHIFRTFIDAGYGLISSGKDVIIHHSPDETFYVFFYPETDLLNTRKVLGRNTDYNMPIIDSNVDKSFKVESNEALKQLLEHLCK